MKTLASEMWLRLVTQARGNTARGWKGKLGATSRHRRRRHHHHNPRAVAQLEGQGLGVRPPRGKESRDQILNYSAK